MSEFMGWILLIAIAVCVGFGVRACDTKLEANQVLQKCELPLPRNQKCVLTAVPERTINPAERKRNE